MLPSATDRKKHEQSGRGFLNLFFKNALNIKNSPFLEENLKILTNDLFTVCFLLIVSLYFGFQKKYIL